MNPALSPSEATELILATAMAAAGRHHLEHGTRNAITLLLANSAKTTSVEEAMRELRGDVAMSEGELEAWRANVDRLRHTVTTDTEERCWFITRRGDRFDVWHVARARCVEAHRAYLAAPSLDDAARRIQAGLRGLEARRRRE